MRYIPQQAIDFIRGAEGCSLHVYKDVAGLLTIGIGHLLKPEEDFIIITHQEAEDLLRNDLQTAANAIARLIIRPLNDNQYSALLSFTYNLGGSTLQRSALRKKCNRGEDDDVPVEFVKYCFAGGKKNISLLKRRIAESKLYMT